ncbi:hypothetical protein AK830_g12634 [Neonectria ditissima]|uniref:Uncharacterized protein n=1 Tax=Neonectria ditissima TaxID=78410 RepID=A0A0P7B030_9HYPO|nr:hypothetical protein AK830_g12634 [Neonectria ditissima]
MQFVWDAAQHSTAQHSTAQHSTAQHSTAQHSAGRHRAAEMRSQLPHNAGRRDHRDPQCPPSRVCDCGSRRHLVDNGESAKPKNRRRRAGPRSAGFAVEAILEPADGDVVRRYGVPDWDRQQ